VLKPTRFQLTAEQLAAALALAGRRPTARSALPVAAPPPDPATLLQGTGMLRPDGRLTGLAADTLRVAADPAHVVIVTANRAGQEAWIAALLLRGGEGETFVMQAGVDGGGVDFAVLPTLSQATVLVDELLDLTAYGPGSGGSASVDLSLSAFAALLAAADAAQETRLAAVLARDTEPEPPQLTAHSLREQLAKGLRSADTRWAVPAAVRAVPVALGAAAGQMEEGLSGLALLGLVRPVTEGRFQFSDEGSALARSFGQLTTTGNLAVVTDAAHGRTALAHLTMFRSPFTTRFVFWTGLADRDPRATMFETTSEAGLSLVRELLGPAGAAHLAGVPSPVEQATAQVTAPAGQAPLAAGFPPAGQAAQAAPPPAAASLPWRPTHRVPQGGMPAWAAPDPARDPVARTDAGVELQLLERDGDWAHIICSNGWSAWVDGRAMEELPG
jgi:hypothetical protein